MKSLVLFLTMALGSTVFGQINGNKNIVTRTFPLEDVRQLEISLYADITVDAGASTEEITLTMDENLIKHVDMEVVDGRLDLGQLRWIETSNDAMIRISAPLIEQFIQGTHDVTRIVNLDRKEFSVMGLVGDIILEGTVQSINIGGELGTIDARELRAESVDVNLWGPSTVLLNEPARITGKMTDGGTLTYEAGEPEVKVKTTNGSILGTPTQIKEKKKPKTRYITVKIKNNSDQRLQAYVRGPKPEGKFFSYGFPMRPNQVKKERWTIGTKVFRTSTLGRRKLIELTAEDEGKTVNLFSSK
ncbi:MAG: DUF2807 domain-containing protein [Bacteroidota bacterium]